MTKYGSVVMYAINFTVSWINTWLIMEVVKMYAVAIVSSPILIRIF